MDVVKRREYKSSESARLRSSQYYKDNTEKVKKYAHEYYHRNSEKYKTMARQRRKNNFAAMLVREKLYRVKRRKHSTIYFRERYRTDINYRLVRRLRVRIGNLLRPNSKKSTTLKLLGCSIEELKIHLESLFSPGMNWNNYGLYGWHIDHAQPLKSFDLNDPRQLAVACHYTNLQPLWAIDNLKKGARLDTNIKPVL